MELLATLLVLPVPTTALDMVFAEVQHAIAQLDLVVLIVQLLFPFLVVQTAALVMVAVNQKEIQPSIAYATLGTQAVHVQFLWFPTLATAVEMGKYCLMGSVLVILVLLGQTVILCCRPVMQPKTVQPTELVEMEHVCVSLGLLVRTAALRAQAALATWVVMPIADTELV